MMSDPKHEIALSVQVLGIPKSNPPAAMCKRRSQSNWQIAIAIRRDFFRLHHLPRIPGATKNGTASANTIL
jgi:hypothetical protein